jgi:hypothetical protein
MRGSIFVVSILSSSLLWLGCTGQDPEPGSMGQAISNEARLASACRCSTGARAALGADESLVGEQDVPLTGLGCTAKVVTAMRKSPTSELRHLMKDPGGPLCAWQVIVSADKDARAAALNEQQEQSAQSLASDWKGSAVVWLKHAPFEASDIDEQADSRYDFGKVSDVIGRFSARHTGKVEGALQDAPVAALDNLTRDDVLGLRADPDVGRVVVGEKVPDKTNDLGEFCSECTSTSGYWFDLSALTAATNFGSGFPTGILEQFVYNCNGLSSWCPTLNGQPVHDTRIKDWTAAMQVAPCTGLGCMFPSYHENMVASRIWTLANAPLKNGNPISVGIGTPNFANYTTALNFFDQNATRVINRSVYDGVDWDVCASAPTLQYDLLQDYYSWSHTMLFSQAVQNTCSSDPACIRLSNAITVGGEEPIMSQTENAAFYSGRLELPTVVGNCYATGTDCENLDDPGFSILIPTQPGSNMCAAGNSFNAPGVTAIASMLRQAATGVWPPNSARYPETLRAIIMAGADYTPYQGIDTASYCSGCVGQYTYCPPVDCKYGAGKVDGGGAWGIYQAGDYQYWSGNPDPGYSTSTADFRCQQSSCYVKAALAWSNVVDCDTLDCNDDGHVIHNFGLCLEKRNGTPPLTWYTPVVCSDSSESTSEWLHYTITSQSLYYRLRLYLVSRTVARTTHFSLAYQADGTTL